MGACNINAPESAASVNMIGWTYPIIDFCASELEACNAVDKVEGNTQLLDSGGLSVDLWQSASSSRLT